MTVALIFCIGITQLLLQCYCLSSNSYYDVIFKTRSIKDKSMLPTISCRSYSKRIRLNDAPISYGDYIPPDVGADIYAGSLIAVLPIVYASVLFAERIKVQKECLVCNGSGLIYKTKSGSALTKPRKCYNCKCNVYYLLLLPLH